MRIQRIYTVTGEGKDTDRSCRAAISEVARACGATETGKPEDAELIIVLGGDGTIMHASHIAQALDIPLIGVNLGRIGYLAELECNELARLADILRGGYREEQRMMLSVRYGEKLCTALNDAVIRAESIHPAHVTLLCDGKKVNTYRGDGLICSTPTGSTAYSVSAGGSVIDPRLDCIAVTPLCAQSLSARPLIFSPQCTLTLRAEGGYRCILTVDGEPGIRLCEGDEITVTRSPRPLRMLSIGDGSFYSTFAKKILL